MSISFLLLGHVDHGKSTLAGQILMGAGIVDKRTLEQASTYASSIGMKGREYAFLLDTDESERTGGKTHESAITGFPYKEHTYEMYDTPGHKIYIREFINVLKPEHIGVVVVSTVAGEFQAGFGSGQIKENLMLLRAVGVVKLIIVANKCDISQYNQKEIDQVLAPLQKFVKSLRFRLVETCYISAYKNRGIFSPSLGCSFMDTLVGIATKEIPHISLPDKSISGSVLALQMRFFPSPKVITAGMALNIHIGQLERQAVIEKITPLIIKPSMSSEQIQALKPVITLSLEVPLNPMVINHTILVRSSDGQYTLGYGVPV